MLIKFIKFLFALIMLTLLYVVVSIKYPILILWGINSLTPYTLSISTTEHNLTHRTITLYDLNIELADNSYSFDSVYLDFTQLYAPKILVNTANIHIKNLQSLKTHNSTFSRFSPQIDITNFTIRYADIALMGSGSYHNGKIKASISPISYDQSILRFFASSDAKSYIQEHLYSATLEDISVEYDMHSKELLSLGTLKNVILDPYQNWQTITAPIMNYMLTEDNLTLNIIDGTMGNLDISQETVIIDWNLRNSVKVLLSSTDSLEQISHFLQSSPLVNTLENTLSVLDITGNATTTATLEFFFDDTIPSNINISSQVDNATVIVKNTLRFTQTVGTLTIIGKNLSFGGSAQFLDSLFDISLAYTNTLHIAATANNHRINITHNKASMWNVDISIQGTPTAHIPMVTTNALLDFSQTLPKITISNLTLITNKVLDHKSLSKMDIDIIPTFRLDASNITIDSTLLPNFAVTIRNTHNLKLTDWFIPGITDNLTNTSFIINTTLTNTQSNIYINIATTQPQSILNILDLPLAFDSNDMSLIASLLCECPFWQIRLDKLGGEVFFNAKQGNIHQDLNSFARLLSLLSIKSFSTRLQLDSDAVSSNNINFTDIDAKAILDKGELDLQNFNLNSDDIIINMTGSTNISTNAHNLNAEVIPMIKDAVPAVSLLSGSGLVGLGVWLVDKTIFDEKLLNNWTNSIVSFNYRITGTWENPIIE